jgi:cathepsin F
MKFLLTALAAGAISVSAVNAADDGKVDFNVAPSEMIELFSAFKAKFGKTYKHAEEELERFKIFLMNVEHAEKMKTVDPTASYSVLSPYADLTPEEFGRRNGFVASIADKKAHAEMVEELEVKDLPTAYDAREHGLVTPIKNQEQCGSCWAFSTVANIEAQNKLVNGQLTSLSEQELVDCSKSDNGCNGGLPTNACKDLIDSKMGMELESAYSYTAATGRSCLAKQSLEKVFLTSYKTISSNEDQIAAALMQYGTLSIGINAQYMQLYTGGISNPFWCPAQLDHGVAIVGFGEDKNDSKFKFPWTKATTQYWVIKNSWGESWGEKGYYRIVRGKGKCGMNQMVSTSIVSKAAAQDQQLYI